MPMTPAVLQIEVNAAGEEQPRNVLVGCIYAALPDAIEVLALPLKLGAQGADGLVVVEPGGVAYDHVDLTAGEGDGAHEVAGVVGPDCGCGPPCGGSGVRRWSLPGLPFR